MEKKITKKIRKKVAEGMRVSEAIGINADVIYAVPGDSAYLAKIIVLGEDEEIDDELVERFQGDLSIGVTALEEYGNLLRLLYLLHNRRCLAPHRWEHRANRDCHNCLDPQ
jgi:hypothetical protein